jgi:hypothetical protein
MNYFGVLIRQEFFLPRRMEYTRSRKNPIDRKKKSWVQPPVGTLNINVDVAFDIDQRKWAMGASER